MVDFRKFLHRAGSFLVRNVTSNLSGICSRKVTTAVQHSSVVDTAPAGYRRLSAFGLRYVFYFSGWPSSHVEWEIIHNSTFHFLDAEDCGGLGIFSDAAGRGTLIGSSPGIETNLASKTLQEISKFHAPLLDFAHQHQDQGIVGEDIRIVEYLHPHACNERTAGPESHPLTI
ncbi:hypothetical protein BS47DRAFT_1342405 [Hydnum rufescens UP504]|uniref:Uncharacterized protein n=1 Tax=Hydnum rufescens UP504 TaxID=1448309 RepID=A0A9P6B2A0_9AGAM|nr:hypothetical protein BS47DRAFT_1342405 [Hydnum rufescens UP504]